MKKNLTKNEKTTQNMKKAQNSFEKTENLKKIAKNEKKHKKIFNQPNDVRSF